LRLAAIDIGSNSIKLIVVESSAVDSFAVLAREKDVVRLGRETLRSGRLPPEAVGRAVESLKRLRTLAQAHGAQQIMTTATASVRGADNAAEFIRTVAKETGLRVEVLSGIEEARLIGLAAAHGCAPRGAALLNIDIGGGSTELSVTLDGATGPLYSIQIGAVGLTDSLVQSDPIKPKELRQLKEHILYAFERPARELREQGVRWGLTTGTSGTILAIGESLRLRALRKVDAAALGARPAAVEITMGKLARFNQRVALLSGEERARVPGISAQRAEIIVAGGHILEGALGALGVESLMTCEWALREGVIIDRLRELEAEARPPVTDDADPRLRGVRAVGERFGYESGHAHRVASYAETIFDALAPNFGLDRHSRTLLSAAALLHDVGYSIAHEAHHKHALYLIMHAELTGFSEAERLVIANVARYHRRSLPKERHADFDSLGRADRETVWRLGGILRVADALDRTHEGRVRDLKCEVAKDTLRFVVRGRESCEREIAAAESKSDMFQQAFDLNITFEERRAR
jgi:exopolyphosphatase/guanosine-5'-triphosphate,3'-diphosphate pyrophosphatase